MQNLAFKKKIAKACGTFMKHFGGVTLFSVLGISAYTLYRHWGQWNAMVPYPTTEIKFAAILGSLGGLYEAGKVLTEDDKNIAWDHLVNKVQKDTKPTDKK